MWNSLSKCLFSTTNKYKYLKVSIYEKVALLQLNRPEALNSLNSDLIEEFRTALFKMERDDTLACVVLTGNLTAFAAGADIAEMSQMNFADCLNRNYLANWSDIANFRKPLIAAVNGYALGGGFELALMCDIIYAGKNSKFGLPEIKLGTIPGGGGTQRLIRLVGKSTAMELTLTGRHIKADEALRLGVASKIFEDDSVVEESLKLAKTISTYSIPALISCKQSILKAEELGLSEGLEFERKVFHSTFALADRKEGMDSFLQKKTPKFTNK